MSTAIFILAASVALPLAAMEARRKWRDAKRPTVLHGILPGVDAASVLNGHPVRALRANPSVERIEPGKDGNGGTMILTVPDGINSSWIAERIASHPVLRGPVWMAVDLGSGKDLSVHSDGSYTCGNHSASGTSTDISSECGGAE